MSSNLAGSMVFCPPDSDGLQVHPYDQYPERYVRTLDTSFIDSKELAPTSPQQYDSSILRDTSNEVSERPLTKRRNWIWTSAALISVIVIVVIIIVAVLLSRKHSGSPSISGNAAPADSNLPTPKDGNQGPSAFTKQGAFNGTGMATMFPYTNSDSVWLLYQHFDGDIQLARLSSSGVWQKPEALGLKNVLNGTALEAMSYESDRMVIFNIFYYDIDGVIQQVVSSNETNQWTPGSIGSKRYRVMSHESAMKAWWSYEYYGIQHNTGGGLRLYAGGRDGYIHEYSYDQASKSWAEGFIFEKTRGDSGMGITLDGSLTTLHTLNTANQLEFWFWAQPNNNDTMTNDYPAGKWNRGANTSTPILPGSSITECIGDVSVTYQDPQNNLNSIGFSSVLGDARWGTPSRIPGAMAIPHTRLTCGYFQFANGLEAAAHVYFQNNESSIAEAVMNRVGRVDVNLLPIG